MRFAIALAVGVTTLTSIPLLAQQTDATAPDNDSAKVTYAPTSGGFGDLAASRAYEMSPVTGELQSSQFAIHYCRLISQASGARNELITDRCLIFGQPVTEVGNPVI